MRFRKIAPALFACLALGAFAANTAGAAEGEGWTIGSTENQTTVGTLISSGVHERFTCRNHSTSPLFFTGELLGVTVKLTADGIDCLEKAGSTNGATIDNTTSRGHSEGVFTFTNVAIREPINCTVPADITTAALTDQVIMDPTAGSSVVFDKYFPEVAGTIVTIEILGPLCPLAEDHLTVTGSVCGEVVHTNSAGTEYEPNRTGTLTKVQTLRFGEAQQKTAKCALTFGGAPAQLTGAVDNELVSGKPFGSD